MRKNTHLVYASGFELTTFGTCVASHNHFNPLTHQLTTKSDTNLYILLLKSCMICPYIISIRDLKALILFQR